MTLTGTSQQDVLAPSGESYSKVHVWFRNTHTASVVLTLAMDPTGGDAEVEFLARDLAANGGEFDIEIPTIKNGDKLRAKDSQGSVVKVLASWGATLT